MCHYSYQPQEAYQVLKCWTHFQGFTAQFHYPKEKTSGPQDKAAKILRKSSELTFYKRMYGNKPSPSKCTQTSVYVVVQFSPWFKFYFPLFLGMVMYDNKFETKENKI